jgi:DNA-binding MarR family transcriptional regulator
MTGFLVVEGDRRGVLVGLTTAGKRAVDGAFEMLIANERELLSELSAAERRELAGLLKRLMKPLR